MTYLVEFAARAARDLEILYKEKNATESHAAARWYNGLEEAVYALASFPQRCPVAPEARRAKRKLRHLLYGKKPNVYRVIYEVDEKLHCGCLPFAKAQGAKSKRLNWCSLCTRPYAEVGELPWDCRFGRNNYNKLLNFIETV